ncbi:MAG: DUF4190 domain-containing protein [Clostridiales Family XIII bacterium]|jgi:hypothetical protein|nr:DUF4190 domain-containing protein [Clostridiales Family XIII bacterium]
MADDYNNTGNPYEPPQGGSDPNYGQTPTYGDVPPAGDAPVYGDAPNYGGGYNPGPVAQPPVNPAKNLALASLIVGIFSVVTSFVIIGLPASIVGLILGIKANKVFKSGLGTAGLIISIAGLVFSVIFTACFAILGGAIWANL